METWLAILRGINVSGKNLIKMAELKVLLQSKGLTDVQTYIQSGNVVFKHKSTDPTKLSTLISKAIKEAFNCDVPVIVRTAKDVATILADNPYLKQKNTAPEHLYVTCLAEVPPAENIGKLEGINSGDDTWQIIGCNIYLHCPGGYGNTKLNNNLFENKLKVTATTRNWKTMNVLLEMMQP
ncbi:MAG: DUF1697 domain-containing protein [Bacteroidota bacterium]